MSNDSDVFFTAPIAEEPAKKQRKKRGPRRSLKAKRDKHELEDDRSDIQAEPRPKGRPPTAPFDVTQALMLGATLNADEAVFLGSLVKVLQNTPASSRKKLIGALGKLFP